tara:strand:- start:3109 stop:3219 length:111 start_codon:yes stop_codon:yes gene_type:complete
LIKSKPEEIKPSKAIDTLGEFIAGIAAFAASMRYGV